MPTAQPPSTLRTCGTLSFIDSGARSTKMSSDSEMWLSAENTSVPTGSPRSFGGSGWRSLGAPHPPVG